MPNFLRLTVPTYFGGLPAGYGFLNNAISGTPANVAGVLTGPSVNAGSYFVGFDDDGSSANANRPAAALGTNTDFLDNLMRADLAYIVRTADVGPTGSPTATVTLTGPNIWMGNVGGYLLRDLFHIVDSNDQDIIAGGAQVAVASFTGGSIGGGFSTGNLVLTLNASIPTGTTYHVYYGSRTNLATLPEDALILPFMRDEGAVSVNIANFVSQVSAPGVLGSTVTSLQAVSFSTPDGHSLAKTSTLVLDCDPTDSGATFRRFLLRTREASTARVVASLYDDPTSSLVAGLTGLLQTDTGVAFSSLGALLLSDLNTSTGGPVGVNKFLSLTGNSNGDSFPRVMEQPSPASLGATAPSLLRLINGRWACTCGDGTLSFGDFNGAGSLDAALVYANAQGLTSIHIQLKRGNYTLTGQYTFTGDVVIEGVSLAQTVITTAVTGGTPIFIANTSSGHLSLKRLTLAYGSGAGCALVYTNGAAPDMDSISLTGIGATVVNSATHNGIAALQCKNCLFQPSALFGGSQYSFFLEVSDGLATHQGYIFENCSWICPDETGPVQVTCIGSIPTAIGGILFRDCRYTLGGTATTAGHLTTNTGVLYVNPAGTNNILIVSDITWDNCYPSGNGTSAANGVLARIYPVALGDNSTNHLAIIQSLTIKGGIWSCNSNDSSFISQFFIAAENITIDGTKFLQGGSVSGGPSSEDQFILDGIAHSVQDWHQFIFATGAQSVSQLSPFPNTLCMNNVSFTGDFNSLSNAGELWLYYNGKIEVDGVRLSGYSVGGSGPDFAPNARVRITAGAFDNAGSTGYIKALSIYGSAENSTPFTNTPNKGYAGLIVFDAAPSAAQLLHVEDVSIRNFSYSGTADDGIVLVNPTTGTPSWRYKFENCTVVDCGNGLIMYGVDTGGSGGNGQPLDGFSIIGGNYGFNKFLGVGLTPDFVGLVEFDGLNCAGNGITGSVPYGAGLRFTPNAYGTVTPCCVTSVNNFFTGNGTSGSGVQAVFITNGSSGSPHLILRNNTALSAAGAMSTIGVSANGLAALPATGTPGSGLLVYGAHTGISSIGSTPVLDYQTGAFMMDNMAGLITGSPLA
jgi:hypothetical protein